MSNKDLGKELANLILIHTVEHTIPSREFLEEECERFISNLKADTECRECKEIFRDTELEQGLCKKCWRRIQE